MPESPGLLHSGLVRALRYAEQIGALAKEGLLEAEGGRHTTTVRVDGQVHRVLRLRRILLKKLWGEK